MNDMSTTADGILDAVIPLFADKGYDAVRVNELAEAAGVNKATLYYQIGDKEALYHAVLERIAARFNFELQKALSETDDPEHQIRAFIRIFAHKMGNARHVSPIMLREIASGGHNMPDSALILMGSVLSSLGSSLHRGVELGIFREVDPFFVHMMIVGSINLYSCNEPIRRRISSLTSPEHPSNHFVDSDEATDKIFDLVIAAIRHHPETKG